METAMTVALDYTPSFYIADGQTKEFQYNFSLTMTSNLVVFTMDERGEKAIVDKGLYDFKINPDNTGGSVTFNKAPESGTNVLIARIETPTQEKDWRNTEGFNLKSLTDEFDKLTRWCQELAENNKRSIVVPENKEDDPLDLYNRQILSDVLESVKYLKIENGNLYYSLDGKNWTMLPKSAMIQEFRQRTVLDEHQVPHTVFEYRIGDKWYDVLAGTSHTGLLDRDAEDSHPISAITNLQSELDKKANGTNVYSKSETYSKEEVDTALGKKANASTTYSKTEVDNALAKKLNIQQGASNVGKILKVGEDGNIIVSSESAGLVSVNHDDTLEGAGTDSSPLTISGEEKLANKITNCILNIPQDINLTLDNGTLTFKAGSKVYFPDGSFVNINSDKTLTPRDYNQVYVVDRSGNPVQWALNGVYSGSDAPTDQQYMLWFDTANNIIKRSDDTGSTWTGDYSFPMGIIGPDDNQNLAIKQVFNGFGFIGNSVFALPGIIGLTPNGRNEDGSLNNTRVVTSNVIVRTFQNTLSQNTALYISENYISALKAPGNYNFETNYNMNGQNVFKACHIGTCQLTQGTVSNFMIKNTFRAVDYNEYAKDLSDINESINQLGTSKQNTLTAGSNIRISGNTISATGLAKTDLSNVSAEGIDTAVGWGMPDYSAGIETSLTLDSFTCDRDYLFIFSSYIIDPGVGMQTITITIDNHLIGILHMREQTYVCLPLYVRKGSIVTVSYSVLTSFSWTRFPLLKGA